MLNTPVLFIIFNRPETTRKVFNAIREAKPRQLFIAADGPRKDKLGEIERCRLAREIATQIDWDCEVKTLFRNDNLGCGLGPAESITWFFEHVEQGIILEDDCLPSQSFFQYCEEVLDRYRDNPTIMHISGNNFQFGKQWGHGSYYFSYYINAWGWATWKRAWDKFDFGMKGYNEEFIEKKLSNLLTTAEEIAFWKGCFEYVKNGAREDIWDYQWVYTCWVNQGISITPNYNLVSNIGFGDDATHTFDTTSKVANLDSHEINVIHPSNLQLYKEADFNFYKKFYKQKAQFNLHRKVFKKFKNFFFKEG